MLREPRSSGISTSTACGAAEGNLPGGPIYKTSAGCCVGSRPNRFLHVMRSFENLSSGEKRAGCADCVGLPSGAVFCGPKASAKSS
eukprot:1195268-Prorocentrum_minimum.AAC.3